ncbi:hypothetical protein F2Q69_00033746 [Brassica cretica]|uniref:Uncharacterized protein n=1 Tax=Brassica cretica TaxID=69181 RepID=A0A8S9SI11_BRACR|nr:hypothetical protein F2Q69_00033746 [Brassica cretica]
MFSIQSSRWRRSISRPTIVLEQELTHRSQQFKHQHALPSITTHRFPLHHRSNTQNSKRSQGIKDDILSDWDLVDNIWEHAFRSCLIIDPKEHPMLLAEPPLNTQQAVDYSAFRSCLIIDPKEHPMLLAEPPLNTQQAVDYSAFRKNLQVSKSSGCKTDSLTEWDIPSGDTSCVYFFCIVETSLCYSPGYTMPDYMECWSQIEYRKEAMKSKTSCDRACLLFNAGSEETVV